MKNKPAGTPLPPRFKFSMEIQFHRQFAFRERLKIMMGYNADIKMVVCTEHHTGKFSPAMDLKITPTLKPKTT